MDFTSLSTTQILDLAKIDPEYAAALENFPTGLIDYSDHAVALKRVRYLTSLAVIPEPEPDVLEETTYIPTSDGHQLKSIVYRPHTTADDLRPLAVLYHAGAHSFGFPAMVHRTARLLVKELGIVVVAPSYRLAPEQKFPTDINDAWDVLVWLTKNAISLQVEYGADKSSELDAPLVWPGKLSHRGLPRVYSQVCGREAARDLALVFDDLLKEEEVPTRLDVYQGLPHCFWYPFKQHSRAADWERDTDVGFKWLLER